MRNGRMGYSVGGKGMAIPMAGIVSIGRMRLNLEVIRVGNRKSRTMMARVKNKRLQLLLLKVLASQIKKCGLRNSKSFRRRFFFPRIPFRALSSITITTTKKRKKKNRISTITQREERKKNNEKTEIL